MTDGLRSALEKIGLAPMSQSELERKARDTVEDMRARGFSDEDIIEAEMQITGGNCPICHKPWIKQASTGMISTFTFFLPDCICIENKRKHRTEEESRKANQSATLKKSHIPEAEWSSDWSNWDYDAGEKLNSAMKYCSDFLGAGLWKYGHGLILGGIVGGGKTRCAIMLLKSLVIECGRTGIFLPMSELATKIIKSESDNGFIGELSKYQAIVVDDMDKIPQDKEWIRGQVFSLFDALVRENVAIIGTTNCATLAELQSKFDYAVISRIIEKSPFVPFVGTKENDYRAIRARKKARKE